MFSPQDHEVKVYRMLTSQMLLWFPWATEPANEVWRLWGEGVSSFSGFLFSRSPKSVSKLCSSSFFFLPNTLLGTWNSFVWINNVGSEPFASKGGQRGKQTRAEKGSNQRCSLGDEHRFEQSLAESIYAFRFEDKRKSPVTIATSPHVTHSSSPSLQSASSFLLGCSQGSRELPPLCPGA